MLNHIRILPVTIIAAVLLLMIKVGDVWNGATDGRVGIALADTHNIGPAVADQTEADPKGADAMVLAKVDEGKAEPAAPKSDSDVPRPGGLADKDPALYTKSELELLRDLAGRRDELEGRARELEMRENLLEAAERRIDEKITELRQIEENIQNMLERNDAKDDEQLKSLVKVYENMKPKDAARIFNQLEMDILLKVTRRMRAAKVASVLARMEPAKAKSLTVELATQRGLPSVDAVAGGSDD